MNCQNCSSDNTQTVKMACLSGSTTGSSTAIGINTNLSVGVASIDSKSQTHLVSTLKPGPKPSKYGLFNVFMVLIGVFGGVVLVLMGIDNLTTFNLEKAAIGIGLGVMIFVALYKFYKMPSEKVLAWYRKNKLYEKGWICHKCGCAWVPGETPVNLSAAQNYEKMGIYTKTFIATSSFFILMGIMAFVTPPSTQSKAPNPTPSKPITPTPPKPALTDNKLDPMAMNVKMKHPDWSDAICIAIGKGELVKGMNSEQVTAAIESKKIHVDATPKSTSVTNDEIIVSECITACTQISKFPVGSADYNACVYACKH